ncbi:MAG: MFS transporter [Hyphomonadaceae bacterium]|nr:MFS transporter [Hyphomonadaceae bacterium]
MTPAAEPPASSLNPLAVPMLAAAYFMLGVVVYSPIGLVGQMSADLDVSEGSIAFLLSALAYTYAVAAPLLQIAIGDWDRRRLLVLGLTVMAIGLLLSAIAPTYPLVVVARMVMALGASLIGPMVSAAAASIVPPERAGRAIGIVLLGISISSVLGVPVASFLGGLYGWRFAMVCMAVACGVIIVGLRATVPIGSRGVRTTPAALREIAGDAVIAPALLVTFFQTAAQLATFSLIAVYLNDVFGVGETHLPAALVALGLASVGGSAIAAQRLGRTSHDRLLVAAFTGVAVMLILVQMPFKGWPALLVLGLWSVASGMGVAPQSARLVALAGDARNMVLTLNAALLQAGVASGAALAGVVHDRVGVSRLPLASLVLMLMAAGIYALSRVQEKRRGAHI